MIIFHALRIAPILMLIDVRKDIHFADVAIFNHFLSENTFVFV